MRKKWDFGNYRGIWGIWVEFWDLSGNLGMGLEFSGSQLEFWVGIPQKSMEFFHDYFFWDQPLWKSPRPRDWGEFSGNFQEFSPLEFEALPHPQIPKLPKIPKFSQINLEKLKERAQRFGLNVSSLSKKVKMGNFRNSGNSRVLPPLPDYPKIPQVLGILWDFFRNFGGNFGLGNF